MVLGAMMNWRMKNQCLKYTSSLTITIVQRKDILIIEKYLKKMTNLVWGTDRQTSQIWPPPGDHISHGRGGSQLAPAEATTIMVNFAWLHQLCDFWNTSLPFTNIPMIFQETLFSRCLKRTHMHIGLYMMPFLLNGGYLQEFHVLGHHLVLVCRLNHNCLVMIPFQLICSPP